MVREYTWIVLLAVLVLAAPVDARQQPGSLRGAVYDKDFEAPLAFVDVVIVERSELATRTSDQGDYLISGITPGRYTVYFSREGYLRQVRSDVVVAAGELTEVNIYMRGDYTDMDELIVEDALHMGPAADIALLQLRVESPALMNSISSELMSRAGASDAGSALKLVSGASVQDGKFAVIRGLPDRYVSSQMNGVRLPTADEDKRAVELDQFPAAVIDSLQVSKTFTPDQQGDASGGAVDVRLRGIPEVSTFSLKTQYSVNSNVRGSDFLSYKGGGISTWGRDDGGRDIQRERIGHNWLGAVGVSSDDEPTDYKWSMSGGGRHELEDGLTIGGFASFFYERDSAFYDDGKNDSLWVETPGEGLVPKTLQGTAEDGDFKTALFDVTQAQQSVQWGGLGTFGVKTEHHELNVVTLYTRTAEDKVTLAEDTRGKEHFFPGYDPDDPFDPGNQARDSAPYVRTETLDYTERTTSTVQFSGRHEFPLEDFGAEDGFFGFQAPVLDWTIAGSSADLKQPDKRQFGTLWRGEAFNPGIPGVIPPFFRPKEHRPFKPAANFNFGNLQRIWKEIDEESEQYFANLKLPFEQWGGEKGYLKFGAFADRVDRRFDQETFSNFGDAGAEFEGDFGDFWSEVFPDENHPIGESLADVDYDGEQDITAWYGMIDMPLSSFLNVVGGFRVERSEIGIVNDPEKEATWFPEGSLAPVRLGRGDADVSIDQSDLLPSIGIEIRPIEDITFRLSYSETIARPTFKELTPIIQQEFLGGPIFIGNPEVELAEVKNYDLRLDYTPYEGGLLSASWFYKDLEDPIENVQRVRPFDYTTVVNYPKGFLTGFEFEVRQDAGRLWNRLDGFSFGANATFIDSEVELTKEEQTDLARPGVEAPMRTRDATGAPEHLYNIYVNYDSIETGTRASLFYTVVGDTLKAGAGTSDGNFVPSVYEEEFDTLNASLTQKLGPHVSLKLQAKNLTNPRIKEVYRSDYIGSDVTKRSFTRGIEYAIGLSLEFEF